MTPDLFWVTFGASFLGVLAGVAVWTAIKRRK